MLEARSFDLGTFHSLRSILGDGDTIIMMLRTVNSRPSISLAVSTSAIFWSIGWSALIREIIVSPATSLQYGILIFSKDIAIKILIILLAFFTFFFVKWLGRVQDWSPLTSLSEFGTRSGVLVCILFTITHIISILVDGFSIAPIWRIYTSWAIWIWVAIPFFVVVIPEKD